MHVKTSAPRGSQWRARVRRGIGAGAVALMATSAVAATAGVAAAQPAGPSGGAALTVAHKAPYFKTTMRVSPGTVSPGARVTISGDAGTPLRAGSTITLQSFAFASRYHVDGVPAVRTQVFADGTYRAAAKIQTGLKHTNYAIDASSSGKPLGPVVWLKVEGRGHTSPSYRTTVRVSPGTVSPGARVTISGDAGTPLRAGSTITLQSFAFASRYHVDGVPAVRTQVFVEGTYRVTAKIQTGLKHTNYAIQASSNGKTLAPVAWLKVR